MERLQTAVKYLQDKLVGAGVDDFEVYARSEDSLEIESKNQEVEFFSRSRDEGVALRVIGDGRMGMSSSSSLLVDSLDRLVKEALSAMRESQNIDKASFPKPRAEISTLAERPGRPLKDISDTEKIEFAKRLEKAALSADPRVVRVRQPRYRESCMRVLLVNSQGISEEAQRSLVFCDVQAVAERNNQSESAAEMAHHIRFDDLDGEGVGLRAGKRAASMLGAQPMSTGRHRICFEPRAAAALLRLLVPSFFAENVQRCKSRLSGRLGDKLFGTNLSIIDHGVLPQGVGSFLFDGEGVLRQRTTMVQSGKVKEWLYDLASAERDGVRSTGNASRRSIHEAPHIAITNTYIEEGSKSVDSLIEWCEGGLCVSDLMGLHTANTITGDFSLGALGFRVEGGEKTEPVRGIMLAGNVIELFRNVVGVGNDLEFFGQLGAPSITVDNVQIDGD